MLQDPKSQMKQANLYIYIYIYIYIYKLRKIYKSIEKNDEI